jgi:hypothetical protein
MGNKDDMLAMKLEKSKETRARFKDKKGED